MSDAPEIPEASSAFEKKIALTIAILAVVLSFVNNKGDNAKTDAILKTSEASNQWAYFQSKSIKGHVVEMHAALINELGGTAPTEAAKLSLPKLTAEIERLTNDKAEIKKKAEGFTKDAARQSEINDECDLSALLLQIGIVVCSVAILSQWKPFWYAGIALGIAGAVFGVLAFRL